MRYIQNFVTLKSSIFLTGNYNSYTSNLQPKDEKPCCGESNNIACLAMFKSLTEKHRTINRMIIMIQLVSFTSAAFEAFAEAYLCFLVSASAKKEMLR